MRRTAYLAGTWRALRDGVPCRCRGGHRTALGADACARLRRDRIPEDRRIRAIERDHDFR